MSDEGERPSGQNQGRSSASAIFDELDPRGGLTERKLMLWAYITAALCIFFSLMPWATVSGFGFSITISGTQGGLNVGGGEVTLVAAVLTGAFVYLGLKRRDRRYLVGAVVAAGITALVAIWNSVDVTHASRQISALGVSASVDWGLILLDITAVVMTAVTLMLLRGFRP